MKPKFNTVRTKNKKLRKGRDIMDYRSSAREILSAIGGKDNLVSAAHCATRLRLIIADNSKIKKEIETATKILSEKEVTAIADVKMGNASATAWGCDLTYEYVTINADYRS